MKANFEKIFNPKSLAIVGANPIEKSVGWGLVANALEGRDRRLIYCVNPFAREVLGVLCSPKITDIKDEVDLAIIAVPAKSVLPVVKECVKKKVGAIMVISSGFAESGKHGKNLQEQILKIAQKAGIPLIGPNCLGILRPSIGLNASFAPTTPKPGNIAFISQSGALLDSVIDANSEENFGFSFMVSYGNEADLELCDFLEYAEKDEDTKVIALYIEGLKDGRRFLETAKRISAKKPIVVLKSGKGEKGKQAISSHVGVLAGNYEVFRAAFKQAGIIEAGTLEDLFAIVKGLVWQPRRRNNIVILTNGGGCGALASDYCQESGVNLAELKKITIRMIEKSGAMHSAWSKRNPVDIVGDAGPERYKVALEAILGQKDIGGVLVIETTQIMTNPVENAKIIIEAKKKFPEKAIVCAFLGGKTTKQGIDLLEQNQIPNYSEIRQAVLAIKSLTEN